MPSGSSPSRAARCFIGAAALSWHTLGICADAYADEPNATAVASAYQTQIRPLLEHYCHDCHGGADVVEGDINLRAIATSDDVGKHSKTWQKASEMLRNGLMPPQDA